MPTPLNLKELHPLDVPVLRDMVSFGALTDGQIQRRYPTRSMAKRRLGWLRKNGLVHFWPRLVQGVTVYFASRLGVRISKVGLEFLTPSLVSLRHNLAVVDLADYLLDDDPDADWRTERQLNRIIGTKAADRFARAHGRRGHRPDGVLLKGQQRIAIELEHSKKNESEYGDICRWYAQATRIHAIRWFIDQADIEARLRKVMDDHDLVPDVDMTFEPFPAGIVVRDWWHPCQG